MSTIVNKTANSTAVEGPTAVTASITPAADSVGIIQFWSLIPGQTVANVPTVTGNGRTWSKVEAESFEADGVLFTYVGIGGGTAGTITITHDGGDAIGCSWSVDEITGCDLVDPIVQSASNSANTGTTASVTLAAFASASNATWAGGASFEGLGLPGTGFTALADYTGAFGQELMTEWRADNDTTPDMAVNNSGIWMISAMEIREAGPPPEVGVPVFYLRA